MSNFNLKACSPLLTRLISKILKWPLICKELINVLCSLDFAKTKTSLSIACHKLSSLLLLLFTHHFWKVDFPML